MTGRPTSRRPRLIATMLCLVAAYAVVLAGSVAVVNWRANRAGPGPVAPGLAALGDDRLADLLPRQRDFPEGWTVGARQDFSEAFGYAVYHGATPLQRFAPAECSTVTLGIATHGRDAAEVSGQAGTGPAASVYSHDVKLAIGRDYDPASLDDMIALVSRCLDVTSKIGPFQSRYTAQVLEDSRPPEGPQRFRYSVTTDYVGSGSVIEYFSYARIAGLALSGSGRDGHGELFDRLFDDTVARVLSVHA